MLGEGVGITVGVPLATGGATMGILKTASTQGSGSIVQLGNDLLYDGSIVAFFSDRSRGGAASFGRRLLVVSGDRRMENKRLPRTIAPTPA